MIRKIRFRFILLAMTTLVVMMTIIVVAMNSFNYYSVVNEADTLLSLLSSNRGDFPDNGARPDRPSLPMFPDGEESPDDIHMQPVPIPSDVSREARFFWVLTDTEGAVTEVDVARMASLGETDARAYAAQVTEEGAPCGFVGRYRYLVTAEAEGSRITFLDCGFQLESFRTFLMISLYISLAGLIVMLIVVVILSARIIRPVAESHEKQKRFITDAGHEIKTPLTVISANVDILEMELGGENECLADIKGQVSRLRTLTEELVMLTRMEEATDTMRRLDFPLSDVVADEAHGFHAAATARGGMLSCAIQPHVKLCGDERMVRRLVSILLDNAVKYAHESTEITLSLAETSRSIQLSVSNETDVQLDPAQLSRIFDRFYRADASRNSETGGHGIGLSVAQAIMTAHGGRIAANI